MKKLLQLLCLCLLLSNVVKAQSILVAWSMRHPVAISGRLAELDANDNTGQTFQTLPKLTMGPNLFADATITGNTGGFGGDIKTAGTIPATFAEALSTGTYYEIVLQPKVGETVSLGSIDFKIRRETDKSPNAYTWTYSVNNTNNASFLANKLTEKTIASTEFYQSTSGGADGTGGNNGAAQPTVNLTNLTNLTSTSTVYLRLYFWNTVDLTGVATATAKGYNFSIAKTTSSSTTDYAVLNIKGITTLPVTLTSFKATKQSNSVRLNWITASEKDNSHFNVLRAGDDKKFTSIAKVNGNGSTNVSKEYTLTDYKPLAGANYYKLSQTDLNGNIQEIGDVQYAYFDLNNSSLTVLYGAETAVVKANLTANKADQATIAIYNISGNSLYRSQLNVNSGINQIEVPVHFQKGMYILKVTTKNGEVWQSKFIR